MGAVYVPTWFNGFTSILLIAFLTAIVSIIVIIYGMKNFIKHNWNEYRCNPFIIPFASLFGKDVTTNFKTCLGLSIKKTIPSATTSLKDRFDSLRLNSEYILNLTEISKGIMDEDNASLLAAVGVVLGRLSDVSTTAQLLMLKIKAIFEKVIALYVTLLYAAWSIMNGMKAIVKDPLVKKSFSAIEKM